MDGTKKLTLFRPRPVFPVQGENDGNQPQYRVPLFAPKGGIPEPHGGFKSKPAFVTRQQFTIPANTTNYAIDSGDTDDNGNTGSIILANIVPQGRFLLSPDFWNISLSSSENSKGVVNLLFTSLTAILRRISTGEGIWGYSSQAPNVAQFYAGIDIPLPPLISDFYTGIAPITDNFQDLELAYSAVFANGSANPHACTLFGTFIYDVAEVPT